MSFVHTHDGWINLDVLARFKLDLKGGYQAVLKDGTIIEIPNFENALTSLVPSPCDWECVIADGLDCDPPLQTVEPIVAWGRTIHGAIRPCTISYPEGVTDPYAVRRNGSENVYSEIGTFSSAKKWLDWLTKPARRPEGVQGKPGRADG